MAFVTCKGTKLQASIATVFTPIAQLLDMKLPTMKSETFEGDTLDNEEAGIPKKPTGRTDAGDVSASLFFDPALASHKFLLSLLKEPATQAWKIVFADTGKTEWPFTGGGFSLGGTVSLKEGLKADITITLDGLPTFPS